MNTPARGVQAGTSLQEAACSPALLQQGGVQVAAFLHQGGVQPGASLQDGGVPVGA